MRNTTMPARSGFTLIELLVVISIIGFMSGMFLVAYQGASQESNIQKTRSTIQKISEVLNARMDEYINYPIALRNATAALPPNMVSWDGTRETVSVLRERGRLLVLRDLIRMEMPDHPDDLKYTTFWSSLSGLPNNLPRQVPTGLGTTPAFANPGFQISAPLTSRTRALIARLSKVGPVEPILRWDELNANAELLFLIVEGSDLNGTSAIELFGKSEIGDTDGDGLKEFIDAFGTPIRWIRWPAGFPGASRFYPDMLDPSLIDPGPPRRLLINSEPLDRLGTDPGWATTLRKPGTGLSPLVISAGTDRQFGIRFREINRYSPPATPPTPVGVFAGIDSYSSAEAPWVDTPAKYGLSGFTDPWYPRDPSFIGIRMGEIVTGAPNDLENGQPVGPRNAGDNISNFEGSAVSL